MQEETHSSSSSASTTPFLLTSAVFHRRKEPKHSLSLFDLQGSKKRATRVMKLPLVSSVFWTVMAIMVTMAVVLTLSAEAGGGDKKSHTIIVKSGGSC